MLSFYEFKLLTKKKQLAYIANHGIPLACRYEDNFLINLYYLDCYFAETWYQTGTINNFGVKAFTCNHELDVYTDFINLDDLMLDI